MTSVLRIESLSKRYRLGVIGRTALHEDLARWWARLRGRPDPTLRIDQLQRLEAARMASPAASSAPAAADHIWALRDVSFEVEQGEVLGIIGRNGAGKSTLLKILSRVTAPTLGCVKIKGRIASLLEVGTGFSPDLTGRENIFLNGTILGMTRAEVRAKFDEIVAFSGCETYIDTPVKRYSSGMYVRLAFAVAAHLDPDILIVDEVLAVGDAEFQRKCLGKMSEVASHGRTVLFVSHNMASIESLCASCILLRDGMVVRRGQPREITSHYLGAHSGLHPGVDFSIRTARLRNQDFLMTNVQLPGAVESDGNSPVVRLGDDLLFEISYKANREVPDVTFFLCLYDRRDNALALHVNTRMSHGTIPSLVGTGTARCRIPSLSLAPGDYRLDAGVLSRNAFLDREQDAMTVCFAPADFYGTGYAAFAHAGRVLFRHKWEIE